MNSNDVPTNSDQNGSNNSSSMPSPDLGISAPGVAPEKCLPKWKKICYDSSQPYPDNYIDEYQFLDQLNGLQLL
jgi:hypothetical protein